MNNKKVSVIVPVFNTDLYYLNKAIDSVIFQSYKNVEIIICNDGSGLNYSIELEKIVKSKNRDIRVINNKINKGLSHARNTAVNYSSGEWLVWLDADDQLYPNTIKNLISISSNETPIAIGKCIVNQQKKFIIKNSGDYINQYSHYVNSIFDPFLLNIFSIQPMILSKKIFEKVGGFNRDFKYAELTELFLRIVCYLDLKKINYHPEAKYFYFRNLPNSLSKQRKELLVYRKKALLNYRNNKEIKIDNLQYYGINNFTGMQNYLPIINNFRLLSPYIKK